MSMAVLIFLSFCESLKDGFKPILIQRAVDAVAPAMNQETVRKRAWTEKLLFLSPTSKNMRISDLLVCSERQKPWPDVDQSPGRKYELTNHISKSKSEISFYFYWRARPQAFPPIFISIWILSYTRNLMREKVLIAWTVIKNKQCGLMLRKDRQCI